MNSKQKKEFLQRIKPTTKKTREEYPELTQEDIDGLKKWLGETSSMLYFKGNMRGEALQNVLDDMETLYLQDLMEVKEQLRNKKQE